MRFLLALIAFFPLASFSSSLPVELLPEVSESLGLGGGESQFLYDYASADLCAVSFAKLEEEVALSQVTAFKVSLAYEAGIKPLPADTFIEYIKETLEVAKNIFNSQGLSYEERDLYYFILGYNKCWIYSEKGESFLESMETKSSD